MAKKTIVVLCIFLAGIAVIYGCKGSETRKVAEEIRDEVTGNRAVQQGEKAKKNIEEIEKQNAERNENFKKQTGDSE
ncbi:MAG: hypothetical protein PHX78_06155 [bacterium]|nr:hypothetical protein [bacterium]